MPPIIIMSTTGFFIGVQATKATYTKKGLREDNAAENTKMMLKNNSNFQSKQILNFIDSGMPSTYEISNVGLLVDRDAN